MGVIEAKVTTEIKAHFHNGAFKTHPTDIGKWHGEETCSPVDFNDEIKMVQLPEGEYKVTIIIEKAD